MAPKKHSVRVALILSAFACIVSPLCGQDVIVSDISEDGEYYSRVIPDVRAEFLEKIEITNLAPLKGIKTCTYAIVKFYMYDTGKSVTRMTQLYSIHYDSMLRAMPRDFRTWQYKPSEYMEKPLPGRYWYSVIYNPPGASLNNPDATPRLTRVVPVVIPKDVWDRNKFGDNKSKIVWADAKISKTGGLMEYDFLPDSAWAAPLKSEVEKALDDWRFAPARSGGAPVVGTLRFPICMTLGRPDTSDRLGAITAETEDKDSDENADSESEPRDIVITPPQLSVHRLISRTAPVFIHPLTSRNGEVMSDCESYAYAIVSQYIDASGAVSERTCMVRSTHDSLKNVLPENYRKLVMQPALDKNGNPSAGPGFWYSVIYNPPAAARGAPDSIPRLLSVYPVEIYGDAAKQFKGKPTVIWCSAMVNKKGTIDKFTLEPEYNYAETLKRQMTECFKAWYFEPARANGKAVATTVRLPVCLTVSPNAGMPSALNPLPGRPAFAAVARSAATRKDGQNTYLPIDDKEIVELPAYTVVGNRVLPPPESWHYTSIPGMEVLSDATKGTTRRFITDFLEFQSALDVVWPAFTNVKPRMPTLFILCGRSRSFVDVQPARREAVRSIDQLRGVFLEDGERSAIIIDYNAMDNVWSMDPYRQMYRLYARFLIRRAAGEKPFPRWLEEGMARIFDTIDFRKNYIKFAKIDDITFSRASRRALMPLRDMFSTRPPSGYNWNVQCYAFVHMCLFGQELKYRKGFVDYVYRVQAGPVNEADFEECFGRTYEQMAVELRGYLGFCYYQTTEYKSKQKGVPVVPPAAQVQVRDATQAEIGRIKGEVLRLGKRVVESRNTLIVPYLRGERDPALLASLGLLESLEKRDDRALKFLEAAAKAGAERPRAYHALAALRFKQESEKIEKNGRLDEAQKSFALAPLMAARTQSPPMPNIYVLFGDILLRSSTPPTNDHLAVLVEGVKYFPKDANVIYKAAQVYAKYGAPGQSRELINYALRLDLKTTMRGRLEALLDSLKST